MRAPRSSRDEPGETVDAPRTAGTTLVRAWGVPQGGRGGAWCDRGGTPALGVSRALEAPASRKRDTDSAGNPRDRDTRTYTGARTHTGALMDDDTAHRDTALMEASHRTSGASGLRNGRRGAPVRLNRGDRHGSGCERTEQSGLVGSHHDRGEHTSLRDVDNATQGGGSPGEAVRRPTSGGSQPDAGPRRSLNAWRPHARECRVTR